MRMGSEACIDGETVDMEPVVTVLQVSRDTGTVTAE